MLKFEFKINEKHLMIKYKKNTTTKLDFYYSLISERSFCTDRFFVVFVEFSENFENISE